NSAASGHSQRPIVSGETFIPKLMSTGVKNATIAASTCAKTPPPNSIASAHVTYTLAAANNAGTRRNKNSELPNSCDAAASNGATGGWSTYPQAGCRPHTIK